MEMNLSEWTQNGDICVSKVNAAYRLSTEQKGSQRG